MYDLMGFPEENLQHSRMRFKPNPEPVETTPSCDRGSCSGRGYNFCSEHNTHLCNGHFGWHVRMFHKAPESVRVHG